jgi:hypothetical protein
MEVLRPNNGEPILYSQRPTTVTDFLSWMLSPRWIAILKAETPNVWDRLRDGWINFSHFSEDIAHTDAHSSLSDDGLFAAYLRGRAILCKKGQTGIDLVIPMVILPRKNPLQSPVHVSHISAIIIQVKNRGIDSAEFKTGFVDEHQFDTRHIPGLTPTAEHPYVGIWMSLRSHMNDLSLEDHVSPPFNCGKF